MKKHNEFKNDLTKLDNNLTYIVGYRNLFNICVLMIGFWSSIIPNPLSVVMGFILVVLGMKWFLEQCRENVDSIDVETILSSSEQPDYDKAKTSNETIRI